MSSESSWMLHHWSILHAEGNRDNATGDDDWEDEQNVPWQSPVLMATYWEYIRMEWRKFIVRKGFVMECPVMFSLNIWQVLKFWNLLNFSGCSLLISWWFGNPGYRVLKGSIACGWRITRIPFIHVHWEVSFMGFILIQLNSTSFQEHEYCKLREAASTWAVF